MTPEQINEVWSMVDRAYLAEVAHRGPAPVFATISGAHLYGFASPDSDVDLRGAFLLPTRSILGLRPPPETITVSDKSRIDLDWVAHDLRKFARLMTNHNGYVLEQLFSPLVVVSTAAFEELRELGRGCITRQTVRHYQGFARGRRKRLHEPDPTVKHLLYAYRVLLSGIHLMRTGEVVANVNVLNDAFRIDPVSDLVERKKQGAEKMRLGAAEIAQHEKLLDDLDAVLAEAHAASGLPDESTTSSALDDFVIRVRLEQSGAA
jgi:predicted nucleotidyltransferase